MPLDKMGLGVSFDVEWSPAVNALHNVHGAFVQLQTKASEIPAVMSRMGAAVSGAMNSLDSKVKQISGGLSQLGGAVAAASIAAIPFSIGLSKAFDTAAKFEQQMGAVGAVAGADAEKMALLTAKASELGVTSVFSATEAAQAMENMARGGAETQDILVGISGVMNAAAAEGMGLAQAGDVVMGVLNGMQLGFDQTEHVANVLALTSAKTASSISGLGESFAYSAPSAKGLGYTLEETAAALGAISDAGLKGSAAGTHFTAMLQHLTKVTPKGQHVLDELGVTMDDGHGKMKKIPVLVKQLSDAMGKKLPNDIDKARAIVELFGTEGKAAFSALESSMKKPGKNLVELTKSLEGADKVSRKFNEDTGQWEDIGAAEEMATKRLDNWLGKVKLLSSSMEQMAIEFFGPMLGTMTKGVDRFTTNFNKVLFAMQALGRDTESVTDLQKKFGVTAVSIALGLRDAIELVKSGYQAVRKGIEGVAIALGQNLGGDGLRIMAKLGAVFFVAAGLLAPLAGLLGALGGIISFVVVPAVEGMVSVLLGAISGPVAGVLLAAFVMFSLIREENESLGETAARVWDGIKSVVLGVWTGAIQPLWAGISEASSTVLPGLAASWFENMGLIKTAFQDLLVFFFGGMEGMDVSWRDIGSGIVVVVSTIIATITDLVAYAVFGIEQLIKILWAVGSVIVSTLLSPFTMVIELVQNLAGALGQAFGGDITMGFVKFWIAITDFVIYPIRFIIAQVTKLAEALNFDVPAGLKKFNDEGLTGLMGDTGAAGPGVQAEIDAKRKELQESNATSALDTKATSAQKANAPPVVEVKNENINHNKVELHSKVCVDGREIAKATSAHEAELRDRAGFKATPYQRRISLEHGAAPVTQG